MTNNTAKDSHYARLRRIHRDASNASLALNNKNDSLATPPNDDLILYGFHAVEAAFNNPRRMLKHLYITKNAFNRLDKSIKKLLNLINLDKKNIDIQIQGINKRNFMLSVTLVEPKALDKILGPNAVHQGIAIWTAPLQPLKNIDYSDSSLVIVLDQITDPHNVGAIMRSAVAFDADSLITTRRHSPQETGVLAKSASGALEKIDFVNVKNLASTLEELKLAGFQTIGLDSEGENDFKHSLEGKKIALVLGAEGKGLRQRTRQTVSTLARLDMPGAIKSLNVSNAAAIALYATSLHING